MPLVSYRASVEAVLRWEQRDRVVSGLRWKRSDRVVPGLHEIHEVAGRRQSAKQVLKLYRGQKVFPGLLRPPDSNDSRSR